MRLFIGIPLPDPISSRLSTLRGSLPSVHWHHPDTYHIALSFIGEVKSYSTIDELELALEKITFPKFNLTINGVGHFTSTTHENSFYASIQLSDSLIQLKKKIDHILNQLDIKPNKQHFIPHITLAKGIGLTEEQIANWIYKYNLFKTEPFEVCEFALLGSYPVKDEPHYITEATYLLR